MKSVKKMLLGLSFLVISTMGMVLFVNNSIIGAVIFFVFLGLGLYFCIDGYLGTD